MDRWIMIVALILFAFLISGCTGPQFKIDNKNTTKYIPKLIEIYVDEDPKDPYNHKEIHIADVSVNPEGNISLVIIDKSQELYIGMLETAVQEIQGKKTLELFYEDWTEIDGKTVWAYMSKEVLPSDLNYIYALREELTMKYGLKGEIKDRGIIFIDHQIDTYGKVIDGSYDGPMIDFPTYEYDLKTNTLDGKMNFNINMSIVAIYGNSFSLNGAAGSGASSILSGVYGLPYESRGLNILKIEPDEAVHLKYDNESIILKRGDEWVRKTSRIDKTEEGSAELTTTERIVNYGLSKIKQS
ncbi:MAG: hypothetical protein ABIJ08_05155 [Nanoarchaeota archaeon]